MKRKKIEGDLRALLRDSARWPPSSVVWVEPRFGINPGQPDTMVLLGGSYVPLELKCEAGVVTSLRPHQRRWNAQALLAGARCLAAGFVAGGQSIRLVELALGDQMRGELLVELRHCELELDLFRMKSVREWWFEQIS